MDANKTAIYHTASQFSSISLRKVPSNTSDLVKLSCPICLLATSTTKTGFCFSQKVFKGCQIDLNLLFIGLIWPRSLNSERHGDTNPNFVAPVLTNFLCKHKLWVQHGSSI